MTNRWAGITLALCVLTAGCARHEQGGGGGGGVPLGIKAPVTLTMFTRTAEGHGTVTFTPKQGQVEVRVRADQLPPPATYQLNLVGPARWRGGAEEMPPERPLGAVTAQNGRVDIAFLVPGSELATWQGLDLNHLPSGNPNDLTQMHPALSSSIPAKSP